jgi:hypothetical protein
MRYVTSYGFRKEKKARAAEQSSLPEILQVCTDAVFQVMYQIMSTVL